MGTAALAGGILTQLRHGNGRSWPENANPEITKNIGHGAISRIGRPHNPLSRAAIATHKILNVGTNGRCRFFVLKGCGDSGDVV